MGGVYKGQGLSLTLSLTLVKGRSHVTVHLNTVAFYMFAK